MTEIVRTSPAAALPLHVVMFDTLGATNDYSNELIEALAARGDIALTVLTLEGSRLPVDTAARVLRLLPDFGAPESRLTKLRKLLASYVAWWAAVADAPRGTIAHMQFFKFAWLEVPLLLLMRARFGAKLVFTAHNPIPHEPRRWHAATYRWWYGRADLVHVLSRNVEQAIESELGARPRRIVRIPHGPYVSLHRRHGGQWTRAQARQHLEIPVDTFVILQFGLFRRYKGLDVLLGAFAMIDPAVDSRLLLAGGGYAADLSAYRHILAESGAERRVRWLDRYVSDEELCLCLTAADLAVFPYRHVSQSGALLMALTFGLPCVASDLAGFREALGFESAASGPLADALVADGDPVALASRLQALAKDPQRLERLRAALTQHVQSELNWSHIAALTADAYRRL